MNTAAHFVLTDGGSNQTECAYLGLPCLVMREKTELADGIGENCILSKFDPKIISDFLKAPNSIRKSALKLTDSPSKIITDLLGAAIS